MRRLFVLLVVPSLLLVAAPPLRADIVERVVAKVNGQIITLSDFQARQIAAAQAARVDPATVGTFLRQNNARILQEAVDDILILQKAEEAGMRVPPQYVDEAIANIKKENNLTNEEQFEEALASQGMTLGELRTNIERGIVRRSVVEREIRSRVEVSETEIKAEYEKLKAEFTKPPTVSLQEILIKEDAGGLERAQEVVAKARAGEDFAALAKTWSAAASKANGGELGAIAAPDMSKELAAATQGLAVGSISEPLPVEGGYRILKVTARTEGSTTPYEGAKERLREAMMMARGEQEYQVYMTDLRKNAQIELRVREVPLQLTGPIPEGSLLEGFDTGLGPAPPTPAAAAPSAAAPPPTPAAQAPAPPPAGADDEISTTPQAAPERVAPPKAAGETPPPPPPQIK